MTKSIIQLDHVDISFGGRLILSDVCIDFMRSDVAMIIGGNGSGKTSLLRCMAGLLAPTDGEIYLRSQPLTAAVLSQLQASVAYIPATYGVFYTLTVKENLYLGASLRSMKNRNRTIGFVVEQFPFLSEVWSCRARQLSGGQQRLLSIAIGLMRSPDVLLIDEPTLGLDDTSRDQVIKSIMKATEEVDLLAISAHKKSSFIRNVSRLFLIDGHRLIEPI